MASASCPETDNEDYSCISGTIHRRKIADEGAMMAVAVVASIPIIILFLSLSKYFFDGSVIYSSSKE